MPRKSKNKKRKQQVPAEKYPLDSETEAATENATSTKTPSKRSRLLSGGESIAAVGGLKSTALPVKPTSAPNVPETTPTETIIVSDTEDDSTSEMTPSSGASASILQTTAVNRRTIADDLEQDSSAIDDMDNVEENLMHFGSFRTTIVGVRFYSGAIGKNEYALLVREPQNPYDRNAIKVSNQYGHQLGHIPAKNGLAGALSPFIAQHADTLRIEAQVAGPRGAYTQPIVVSLYGTPDVAQQAAAFMQRCSYMQGVTVYKKIDVAASSCGGGKGGRAKVVTEQTILEKKLELLYDQGMQYTHMPEAAPQLVETELLEHQRKGLWWMLQHERVVNAADLLFEQPQEKQASGDVGLFRKVTGSNGGQYWENVFTQSLTDVRSPPMIPRGGILADDMGLGKTIQVLALIATQKARRQLLPDTGQPVGKTLIVCPLSVMHNWIQQTAEHTPALSVLVFHGSGRKDFSQSDCDIVLTTYTIIASEATNTASVLLHENWGRVVFDEAHSLRNPNTKQTKAAFKLKVDGPTWMLTGTPIQNQIIDLWPLVKMIGVAPFQEKSFFINRITRPLKFGKPDGINNLRTLVGTITLRRLKGLRVKDKRSGIERPLVALPPKSIQLATIPFQDDHQALYDSLWRQSAAHAQHLVATDKNKSFMGILQLLGRLRQLCCDGRLLSQEVLEKLRAGDDVVSPAAVLKQAKAALGEDKVESILAKLRALAEDECCICLDAGGDCITRCTHVFHRACIEKALASTSGACPLCRQPVRVAELIEHVEESADVDDAAVPPNLTVGAKLQTLKQYISDMDKSEKLVVFSSFVKYLDLAKAALESPDAGEEKVRVMTLDGRMSRKQRSASMDAFAKDPDARVMLCSLKAAGVGVTLTAANHLILLDPWWNPAAEEQAIDRIYRIGQTKPVTVTRFVMQNSIEEKIIKLAGLKKKMYEGALEKKSPEELKQVRWQIMQSIFEM